MRESVLRFGTASSLVGVVTDHPEAKRAKNLPAMILMNAGIVHRVGPNRLFVKIARHLAAMGFVVLRFDYSGHGDSTVREDDLPFEKSAVSEIQDAMTCLSTMRKSQHFVLIGMCSGTLPSFRTACCDPRVVGLVLLNALLTPVDEISEKTGRYFTARKIARGYWQSKVFDPRSWWRFVKGKANYAQILWVLQAQLRSGFFRKRVVSHQVNTTVADLRMLLDRGVEVLFVYSETSGFWDYHQLTIGDAVQALSTSRNVQVETVPQATHMFSLLEHQEHVLKFVGHWAQALR